MAKLPRAPDLARLSRLDPVLIALAPGQLLYRVYSRGGSYPTHWNAFRHFGPLSRFDHHLPDRHGNPVLQTCGMLYAATDVATAVAEFFERNRRRVNRIGASPGWSPSRCTARCACSTSRTISPSVRAPHRNSRRGRIPMHRTGRGVLRRLPGHSRRLLQVVANRTALHRALRAGPKRRHFPTSAKVSPRFGRSRPAGCTAQRRRGDRLYATLNAGQKRHR